MYFVLTSLTKELFKRRLQSHLAGLIQNAMAIKGHIRKYVIGLDVDVSGCFIPICIDKHCVHFAPQRFTSLPRSLLY